MAPDEKTRRPPDVVIPPEARIPRARSISSPVQSGPTSPPRQSVRPSGRGGGRGREHRFFQHRGPPVSPTFSLLSQSSPPMRTSDIPASSKGAPRDPRKRPEHLRRRSEAVSNSATTAQGNITIATAPASPSLTNSSARSKRTRFMPAPAAALPAQKTESACISQPDPCEAKTLGGVAMITKSNVQVPAAWGSGPIARPLTEADVESPTASINLRSSKMKNQTLSDNSAVRDNLQPTLMPAQPSIRQSDFDNAPQQSTDTPAGESTLTKDQPVKNSDVLRAAPAASSPDVKRGNRFGPSITKQSAPVKPSTKQELVQVVSPSLSNPLARSTSAGSIVQQESRVPTPRSRFSTQTTQNAHAKNRSKSAPPLPTATSPVNGRANKLEGPSISNDLPVNVTASERSKVTQRNSGKASSLITSLRKQPEVIKSEVRATDNPASVGLIGSKSALNSVNPRRTDTDLQPPKLSTDEILWQAAASLQEHVKDSSPARKSKMSQASQPNPSPKKTVKSTTLSRSPSVPTNYVVNPDSVKNSVKDPTVATVTANEGMAQVPSRSQAYTNDVIPSANPRGKPTLSVPPMVLSAEDRARIERNRRLQLRRKSAPIPARTLRSPTNPARRRSMTRIPANTASVAAQSDTMQTEQDPLPSSVNQVEVSPTEGLLTNKVETQIVAAAACGVTALPTAAPAKSGRKRGRPRGSSKKKTETSRPTENLAVVQSTLKSHVPKQEETSQKQQAIVGEPQRNVADQRITNQVNQAYLTRRASRTQQLTQPKTGLAQAPVLLSPTEPASVSVKGNRVQVATRSTPLQIHTAQARARALAQTKKSQALVDAQSSAAALARKQLAAPMPRIPHVSAGSMQHSTYMQPKLLAHYRSPQSQSTKASSAPSQHQGGLPTPPKTHATNPSQGMTHVSAQSQLCISQRPKVQLHGTKTQNTSSLQVLPRKNFRLQQGNAKVRNPQTEAAGAHSSAAVPQGAGSSVVRPRTLQKTSTSATPTDSPAVRSPQSQAVCLPSNAQKAVQQQHSQVEADVEAEKPHVQINQPVAHEAHARINQTTDHQSEPDLSPQSSRSRASPPTLSIPSAPVPPKLPVSSPQSSNSRIPDATRQSDALQSVSPATSQSVLMTASPQDFVSPLPLPSTSSSRPPVSSPGTPSALPSAPPPKHPKRGTGRPRGRPRGSKAKVGGRPRGRPRKNQMGPLSPAALSSTGTVSCANSEAASSEPDINVPPKAKRGRPKSAKTLERERRAEELMNAEKLLESQERKLRHMMAMNVKKRWSAEFSVNNDNADAATEPLAKRRRRLMLQVHPMPAVSLDLAHPKSLPHQLTYARPSSFALAFAPEALVMPSSKLSVMSPAKLSLNIAPAPTKPCRCSLLTVTSPARLSLGFSSAHGNFSQPSSVSVDVPSIPDHMRYQSVSVPLSLDKATNLSIEPSREDKQSVEQSKKSADLSGGSKNEEREWERVKSGTESRQCKSSNGKVEKKCTPEKKRQVRSTVSLEKGACLEPSTNENESFDKDGDAMMIEKQLNTTEKAKEDVSVAEVMVGRVIEPKIIVTEEIIASGTSSAHQAGQDSGTATTKRNGVGLAQKHPIRDEAHSKRRESAAAIRTKKRRVLGAKDSVTEDQSVKQNAGIVEARAQQPNVEERNIGEETRRDDEADSESKTKAGHRRFNCLCDEDFEKVPTHMQSEIEREVSTGDGSIMSALVFWKWRLLCHHLCCPNAKNAAACARRREAMHEFECSDFNEVFLSV